MATNLNRWVGTGNLTADPELRSTPAGTSVCRLRIAVNERRKDSQSGEWREFPNYFTVTVWGAQGENCARYLSKGRGVAIDGRLTWREWKDKQENKRESVEITAETVQFLSSPQDGGGGYGGDSPAQSSSDVPAGGSDFEPVPSGGADDDIPF